MHRLHSKSAESADRNLQMRAPGTLSRAIPPAAPSRSSYSLGFRKS